MFLRRFIIIYFFIGVFVNTISGNDHKDEENEEFKATNEWQSVKTGQSIPAGLHVRINLETGEKEAKILDQDDNSKSTAVLPVTKEEEKSELDIDGVKDALKKIKGEDVQESIKGKFRSYEEIKKDLEELELDPKTDAELLKELIGKFEKYGKVDRFSSQILILYDLEYLLHQFDNAIEFTHLKGFEKVAYKAINSTSSGVRKGALVLLGTAVQNNVKVQIHALETGALDILLRTLAMEQSDKIKATAVFALSGLLRRFPLAQVRFAQNAGLSVCLQLLEKTSDLKTQLKMVTFIADLMVEYKSALALDGSKPQNLEKIRQYKQIDLGKKLEEHEWCKKVKKVLANVLDVGSYDHDSIEKMLGSLLVFTDLCSRKFDETVELLLVELKTLYEKLSENSSDDYFKGLLLLCNLILERLTPIKKDEL